MAQLTPSLFFLFSYTLFSMIKEEDIYIYGKHAVEEALRAKPKSVKKIFLSQELDDPKVARLISENKIPVSFVTKDKMPSGTDTAVHQGVAAAISLNALVRPYDEFIKDLEVGPDTVIAVLGEIQDPQNVGAVIRSAAAFGITAVLLPEHNQAPVTGTVVKVSAGMVFRMPIVSIGNVNLTLRDLKDRGFWVYGLAAEGEQSLSEEKFDAPTVFVLGNEMKGIREKTRDVCDVLLSIPIAPRCESLNAATAASVSFYAWSVKHPNAVSSEGKK